MLRPTHFFGGSSSGIGSRGGGDTRTSRSPPPSSGLRDDGGLSDLLGTSTTQGQGRSSRGGAEEDPFGLYSSSGTGTSRLRQSGARLEALFGEEVRGWLGRSAGVLSTRSFFVNLFVYRS